MRYKHLCRACGNSFTQPFVCTTCGAVRLYDETLKAARAENERLRAALDYCKELLIDLPASRVDGTRVFNAVKMIVETETP